MKVFLVRHGQTDWNVGGRFQGQVDTLLNNKGLAQAESVAERLSNHKFASIVSSPLRRALDTARAISNSTGVPLVLEDGLTEINHGLWEGEFADYVREKWTQELSLWHEAPHLVTMPGGESLIDVQSRAISTIEKISRAMNFEGDICIVSHDAVLKALFCWWVGAPLSSFWHFVVPNASVSIVELNEDRDAQVHLLSDASHWNDSFNVEQQKGL